MTSSQETQWVYSYNPGTRMGMVMVVVVSDYFRHNDGKSVEMNGKWQDMTNNVYCNKQLSSYGKSYHLDKFIIILVT